MRTKSGGVSVIVVNFNGMPHIDRCLASVLAQAHPDFEVILVDNCSTDGSLEHARDHYPGVRAVANSENLGYAGGINVGLAAATGGYIAPLNADTEMASGALKALSDFLDENQQAGVVTPKVLLFDRRDTVNALGSNIHISGLGFCRGLGRKDDGRSAPEKVCGVSGSSYMIRRELLEQMGGVPLECFQANDDVVVSWMVNLMGYDAYCVRRAVVYHKYRLRMSPDKLCALEKNRLSLVLYGYGRGTLVALSPVLLVTELLIAAYCLRGGWSYVAAKSRAVRALWAERELIRQRRAVVKRVRRISDRRLLGRLRWNLEWGQLLQIA